MEDFDKLKEFTVPEVTEEFSNADGEMKLLKRKVVHKVVPSASWGVSDTESGFESMSDEELEREIAALKLRL